LVADVGTGAVPDGESAVPTVEGVRAASTPNENSVSAGARAGAVGPESVTVTGMTLGTPAYMAPEQAAGQTQEVGPLTDVYALGAILYELLTGQAPFSSNAFRQTLQDVQEREPPPPRTRNPRVDPDLEAVCLKCLKKKPCDRYPSAEALADDLALWLRGKPPRARPFLPWHARIRRSARRHPALSIIFVLGAIAAIVAPTVAYLRDPARQLECIERSLAQGNPVTLVGEVGPPVWFSWPTNVREPSVCQAPDGAFSIQAGVSPLRLLELLPDPQQARYRFSAEVRQDSSPGGAQMGIYFAHSKFSTPVGVKHCFADITLDDNVFKWTDANVPRENPVWIRLHFMNERKWEVLSCSEDGDRRRPFTFSPSVFDKGQGPWHKLAVDVTPEKFDVYWEDRLITSLSREWCVQRYMTYLTQFGNAEGVNAEFAPRGALGLYVYYCTASFRRVLVEPLGEKN
jgi:serine/threonine-protein kinase